MGVPVVRITGPGTAPAPDALVDIDGSLMQWMRNKGATALALRPDKVIYAAAGADSPLPPPPAGMKTTAPTCSDDMETLV